MRQPIWIGRTSRPSYRGHPYAAASQAASVVWSSWMVLLRIWPRLPQREVGFCGWHEVGDVGRVERARSLAAHVVGDVVTQIPRLCIFVHDGAQRSLRCDAAGLRMVAAALDGRMVVAPIAQLVLFGHRHCAAP